MTAATDVLPADRVAAAETDGVLLERLVASGRGTPEAVLHPHDTDEVTAVMRWASSTGTGVLPVASGARLRPIGGRDGEPRPWIVLSTDRLSGLEIYEAADLTLTAGAGTSMYGGSKGAHCPLARSAPSTSDIDVPAPAVSVRSAAS